MSNFTVTEYVSGGAVTADNLNAFIKTASPTKEFVNTLDDVNVADVGDLRVVVSSGSGANDVAAKATSEDFINLHQNELAATDSYFGESLQGARLGLGYQTCRAGIANLSVGPQAAQNSTGHCNIHVGARAGQNGSTGDRNVGVGVSALREVGASSSNVAIGFLSLTGTPGDSNVAVGDSSGKALTGSNNVALGASSMQGTSSGDFNVAIGSLALSEDSLATASKNIAIGAEALAGLKAHGDNVAVGYRALESGGSIQQAVAVGSSAGENSTGTSNTFVGFEAGKSAGSASNSVAVGHGALVIGHNCTVLGAGAAATKGNQTVLGSPNAQSVKINGVPSSPTSLAVGEIYHDGGALKIKI